MKTDIPLKRLTHLRPADLLLLPGTSAAEVLSVDTLQLPASATSLDTVLRLCQPDGTAYLHVIEWQGYYDILFLWRVLGYLAWLGQNQPERPILVTLIYLKPDDDVGNTLIQHLAGQPGWIITLPCIRLWQEDAAAVLSSGRPGLAALSPLMHGATDNMVEQAASFLPQAKRRVDHTTA